MSESKPTRSVRTAEEVLAFWLGAYPFDDDAMRGVSQRWFEKNPSFDTLLKARFGATLDAARKGQLDAWADAAEGALALIIVLDQFSRNIYRGDARSFAADDQALALAQQALENGHDALVPPLARQFFYLPLQHAEDAQVQQQAVARVGTLLEDCAPQDEAYFKRSLDFARRHRDLIGRYGRFPHRNRVLGRPSTADEMALLATPGSGF